MFHEALREHGEGNFDWSVVKVCDSKGDLDRTEKETIEALNTVSPNGYNTKDGALSGGHAKSSKQKMSEARTKYWKNKGKCK